MSIKEKEKCRCFQKCSAVFCPHDILPNSFWFSDSEICRLIKWNSPEWLRTQKKISEINPDPHSYYTIKMLLVVKRVKSGITGLVATGYYELGENEWIRGHKKSVPELTQSVSK